MASNQLPDTAREQITKSVDQLLGRVLHFHLCPLDDHERDELVWCCYDDATYKVVTDAVALLDRGTWENKSWLMIDVVSPVMGADMTSLHLRHTNGTYFHAVPPHAEARIVRRSTVYARLGTHRAEAFYIWLAEAVAMTHRSNEAWACLQDVMKMVTTAGQLRRMVPDLATFLPSEVARMLLAQKRASSVPFEWTAYPRDKIERMCNTLATARLLPEQNSDGGRSKWSDRTEATWPHHPDPESTED